MNPEIAHQLEQFDRIQPAGDNERIHRVRTAAVEAFQRLGFPTTKSEEYRYTNVSAVAAAKLNAGTTPASLDAVPAEALLAEPDMTFVDGVFAPALSNGHGAATVRSFRELLRSGEASILDRFGEAASHERNGFYALNTAFAEDGAVIEIAAGAAVSEPVRVLHISTDSSAGAAHHLRHMVVVGRGAEAVVVEEFLSLTDHTYLNNLVREVFLEDGARLSLVEINRESSHHISALAATLPRDSHLKQVGFTLSGELVRRESHVTLNGEGADSVLAGVYLPRDKQVHDQLTLVDHAVPRCTSNQLYKGVLDGHGRGVFNGKVLVRQDAQQTLAYQQNRSLVLSDNATADTRPQLEIYADDVKCSHGATIGQLDDDALFYLRSRGISQVEAGRLLMRAFVGEVVELVPETMRPMVLDATIAALPGTGS